MKSLFLSVNVLNEFDDDEFEVQDVSEHICALNLSNRCSVFI